MITIKKIVLKDGTVRYRACGVSVGRDPVTGKRAQRTITCDRRKDVEAELAKIGYQVSRGTYVKPWDGLVPELIDSYLKHGAVDWEENTKISYAGALAPAREWFAHRKARTVMREDVEEFRDHLRDHGRKRGGPPGTGLSPRSVNLTLGQLQAAWDLAERDEKVARNPVRFVKRIKNEASHRSTWSAAEVRKFLATAAADRLHACWRLTLYGERRGEVLGERWDDDVDLTAKTITIARTRVLVNGRVIVKAPKSERGARPLPLDDADVTALKALRKRQLEERLAAGEAYADSGYVAVDELGAPIHPERYSDEFARLCREAGVPLIRLHDARHTINSLLAAAGVPPHIRAAWCGHDQAVNEATYTHARPEDLAVAGAALSKILNVL